MCSILSLGSPFCTCVSENISFYSPCSWLAVDCGWVGELSLVLGFSLRLEQEQCLSIVRGRNSQELPTFLGGIRTKPQHQIQVLRFSSYFCSVFLAARTLHLWPEHSMVCCFSPRGLRLFSMGEKGRMRVVFVLSLQDCGSSPCLSTSVLRTLAYFHSLSPEHKMEENSLCVCGSQDF